MRALVTGGVRSGKSRHAESLLPPDAAVAYVAPGPSPVADDADWAARVAAHRAARPAHWTTHETTDVATVIAAAVGPVLVDCLGTWLTATIDAAGLWEAPSAEVAAVVDEELARLGAAVASARHDVVLVTNEVGLGVVPAYRSGRLFRDLLGTVNQQVAAVCDEVHLVIAGRVLRL
ncbi:adenosylcobinamide kinase /adenosylcobinamide-phosphate guanylyltransferase [Nocardioides terrae]|uniref:Adenosylcobinamide kinase n=1 Tax=Nocardioides terrae TaxID=574651 RepID=A0A1I1FI79_9ACTN|nr:bifunctional adenosylcobinamide kinase/adenosylcobinamide-phosphate guanylyltransferase [Nocardioides terrae]SFB99117.1 adenosylcobinamide kinase /adenosylcobinamide-phosphate guanylyltransferase [Nocardioides terrae]